MRALAIGIGNSTIRAAVMEGSDVRLRTVCTHAEFREHGIAWEALRAEEGLPSRAGVCSVVPALSAAVERALRDAGVADIRHVRAQETPWFPSAYRSMDSLGADRFAAALAAKERYGAPCIVIDCGTATTINVVDRDGVFRGGSIAVGVETAFRALHRGTAQLPDLSGSAGDVPLIGRDTGESIISGVLPMQCRALEGMVTDIIKIIGSGTRIILTGGNAARLQEAGLRFVAEQDDDLLLRGIIFFLHFTG